MQAEPWNPTAKAALVGGTVLLLVVFSVVSELSPLHASVTASGYALVLYFCMVLFTLPAIALDVAAFGDANQPFHWVYFLGVFLEGAAIGALFAILLRAFRARKSARSSDTAA